MSSISRTTSTTKARATNAARKIIRAAYTIDRASSKVLPIRYELLSSGVAVGVFRRRRDGVVVVKVARPLADGGAKQMRKECRTGFATIHELIAYFESLYSRYGRPDE